MTLTIESRHTTVDLVAVVARFFDVSRTQARRLIEDGAISALGDGGWTRLRDLTCARGDLEGRVLRKGKRHFVRVA